MSISDKKQIAVAAGVLINEKGEVLFAQRPSGKPWEGWWELPGGKLEPNETAAQALVRELREELGITATRFYPWVSLEYEYPNTSVILHFFRIYEWLGTPSSLEQQQFAWSTPKQAQQLGNLLPASELPLRWLQLPTHYVITHIQHPDQFPAFLGRLEQLPAPMVQFREANWQGDKASLEATFEQVRLFCQNKQLPLVVNSRHPRSWWQKTNGVHLTANDAIMMDERPLPQDYWVGVSTHHLGELLYAQRLGADFATFGHVLATPSHPEQAALGWENFKQTVSQVSLPVYAIGGMNTTLLSTAFEHQAQGIAGIRYEKSSR